MKNLLERAPGRHDGFNRTDHARSYAAATVLCGAVLLGAAPARAQAYATSFEVAEDPLSEGGRWINGGVTGLDWSNVSTVTGRATGTQQGPCELGNASSSCYDDAIAMLAGTWAPDQAVVAKVYAVNPHNSDGCNQEVELHLRTSISSHWVTTYEVLFNVRQSDLAYTEIVRWDGPLGTTLDDFTFISPHLTGSSIGVGDGDLVMASITGNHIQAYINGVLVNEAWDDTLSEGSPGIGFYWGRISCGEPGGSSGDTSDYGFSCFTATAGGPASRAPNSGAPWPMPGRVEAEDFDLGGEGIAFHDLDVINAGGAYRPCEGADVQVCSDDGGGHNIGWVRSGEWLAYTVDVASSGTWTLAIRIASGGTGGVFHIEMDGDDVTGPVAFDNTGGWGNWTTLTLTGIYLNAGVQVMTLVFDSELDSEGMGNVNFMTFTSEASASRPSAPTGLRILP